MGNRTKARWGWGLASLAAIILAWQLTAILIGSAFILPGPLGVLIDGIKLVSEKTFWALLGATCLRGVVAFLASFFCSVALGLAAGISESFAAALKPWLTVIKSTPVVSFILIALLWFGSSSVPVFVAILMTLPVMTESIAQGVRRCDPKLLEMGKVYRLSAWTIISKIRLPSATPYVLAGAGTSLGLTWKVVVAGEILSSPKLGLGSAMQTAKVHLETARVFSLTVAAIVLSVATDFAFERLVALSKRHEQRNDSWKSET